MGPDTYGLTAKTVDKVCNGLIFEEWKLSTYESHK